MKEQEEKRKAQEEQRKAQEEQRKAQEEKRKAQEQFLKEQEEKRKAQEEQRKAQEELRKAQEQARVEREAAKKARKEMEEYRKKPTFEERVVETRVYKSNFYKWERVHSAEAVDVATGITAKAQNYYTEGGAKEHARINLKAILLEKGIIRKD